MSKLYHIDLFRKRLGEVVAEYKTARSLAVKAGISQSTLHSIIDGGPQGPSLAKIYELTKALGEDKVIWLLFGHLPGEAVVEADDPLDEVIDQFRTWAKLQKKADPAIGKLVDYYLDQVKEAVKEMKKVK